MHACMCTHARAHAPAHACAHTPAHIRRTNMPTQTPAHMPARSPSYISGMLRSQNTSTHATHTKPHSQAGLCAFLRTCLCAYPRMPAYMSARRAAAPPRQRLTVCTHTFMHMSACMSEEAQARLCTHARTRAHTKAPCTCPGLRAAQPRAVTWPLVNWLLLTPSQVYSIQSENYESHRVYNRFSRNFTIQCESQT